MTRHLAAFLQAQGDGRAAGASHARAIQRRRIQGGRTAAAAAGHHGRVVRRTGAAAATGRQPRSGSGRCPRCSVLRLAKQRGGMRIRGGTARAYYVGIETAGLAVRGRPGRYGHCASCQSAWKKGPRRTCPLTRSGWSWANRPISLFQFFGAEARSPRRRAGRLEPDEITETDSLEATLPPAGSIDEHYVPVRFHARITELGVLELWCVSTTGRSGGNWSSACGRDNGVAAESRCEFSGRRHVGHSGHTGRRAVGR